MSYSQRPERLRSLGKAVEGGVLRYASPSQVKKHDPTVYGGCNRRWWLDKVAGLEDPKTSAQDLGTEAHSQLEHYLLTGEDVRMPLLQAGRHLVPPREGGALWVERAVHEGCRSPLLAGDVRVVGFMDLVLARDYYVDGEGAHRAAPDEVEVVDWKTTKSLDYARTAEQLGSDPQMVAYAEWARLNFPGARAVRASHVYFVTAGRPRAEKRTVSIGADTVAERWHSVVEEVGRMQATARLTRVEDVAPNYASCEAYRGCPFRDRCPRSPDSVWFDLGIPEGGGEEMSLLDDLFSDAPAAPAAPPPTPAPAPTRAAGVLPPDAPRSEPPLSAVLPPAEVLAACSPEVQVAAGAFQSAAPPAEAPKKTRAKKAPAEARAAAPDEHGVMPDPGAVVTTVEVAESRSIKTTGTLTGGGQAPATVPGGLIILADVPVVRGLAVQPLEPWLDDLCRRLLERFGKGGADIRCVPDDSTLAFGKWEGAVFFAVRQAPPSPGTYSLQGVRESKIKQVALQALEGVASVFMRGSL